MAVATRVMRRAAGYALTCLWQGLVELGHVNWTCPSPVDSPEALDAMAAQLQAEVEHYLAATARRRPRGARRRPAI